MNSDPQFMDKVTSVIQEKYRKKTLQITLLKQRNAVCTIDKAPMLPESLFCVYY